MRPYFFVPDETAGSMRRLIQHIEIKNAQDLCEHVEKSHLAMPGCPVRNTIVEDNYK